MKKTVKRCQLCHRECEKLYKHHYPVPEDLGGTKTILVGAVCHQKDHQLITKLLQEIEVGAQSYLPGIPDPYAERREILRAAVESMGKRRRLI